MSIKVESFTGVPKNKGGAGDFQLDLDANLSQLATKDQDFVTGNTKVVLSRPVAVHLHRKLVEAIAWTYHPLYQWAQRKKTGV